MLPVRSAELARTLEVSGGLKAVNSAVVKARVAAEVKTLAVREGDRVQAGQVLGQLDTTEFDWRLRQAEQQARPRARSSTSPSARWQNNRALVAQGFISPTALETSVSNEAGAQATLQAAHGRRRSWRARREPTPRCRAPIAGLIVAAPGAAGRARAGGRQAARDRRPVAPRTRGRRRAGGRRPAARRRDRQLQVDGIDGRVTARVVRINPSAQAGSRAVSWSTSRSSRARRCARACSRAARSNWNAARRWLLPLSAVRTDQARPYVLRLDGAQVGAARR